MDDQSVPGASGHAIAPDVHPSRPVPPASIPDRLRAWIDWFGVGRLLAASLATVVVCAGGYWLIRTPPPATEAGLSRSTASTVPVVSSPADAGGGVGALGGSVTASTTVLKVTVHVAGAVVAPGVYTLSAESRVHHAVDAAGGVTADADPDALNLAGQVVDGTRVYVPRVGEAVPALPAPAPVERGPVDVNRATEEELDELPGVGPATAAAIVEERERNGPFAGVDDLERVPGIGPAKLDALRDLVTT